MRINDHPMYNKLIWIARWKIFNYTHARGFWFPTVPMLLACALLLKAIYPVPFADYMIYFSIILYIGELPLLFMLARRAQHQSIGAIGISSVDKHYVSEGLKIAKVNVQLTDHTMYIDFIVCNLIGELARVDDDTKRGKK